MIRRSEEHPVEERLKMRDGNGVVEVVSLEKELLPEKCRLFGLIRLKPGCSIGEHEHVGEADMFYFVSGEGTVTDVCPDEMTAILEALREMGCALTVERDRVAVVSPKRLAPFRSLMTSPHPGFPTDMQAQMLALATRACGTSVLTENVFENRFNHVPDLCRMGADVIVAGRTAIVRGVETLHGARVAAHDLRGGAALVLAALCAEGETLVDEAEHIDRGYESLETELNALGARVTREER